MKLSLQWFLLAFVRNVNMPFTVKQNKTTTKTTLKHLEGLKRSFESCKVHATLLRQNNKMVVWLKSPSVGLSPLCET